MEKEKDKKLIVAEKETQLKNAVFISDSKSGEHIELASTTSSLNKLIKSAFLIKKSFFSSRSNKRDYIQ